MDGRDQCSPTDETLNRLPGIDTAKDQNLILGPLCHLAPMFFFIMFPYTVFEYILEKVRANAAYFTALPWFMSLLAYIVYFVYL